MWFSVEFTVDLALAPLGGAPFPRTSTPIYTSAPSSDDEMIKFDRPTITQSAFVII